MPTPVSRVPRLGFLGLGWIGRMRMRSLAQSDEAQVAALADPADQCVAEARRAAPDAIVCAGLDELLEQDLDGIVIATPNAVHAEQALAALDRGFAVFCQKPLAVSGVQAHGVVARARERDRLLGVDLSYRHLRGMRRMRQLIRDGSLGDVYALSLVFHNAYGPDKRWCYQRESAGGGCVIDLGVHLIDLALWLFDATAVAGIDGCCYAGGRPVTPDDPDVEDYATFRLHLDNGAVADIACSWHLPLGQDADIRMAAYGTRGGVAVTNVDGSFFDFRTELYDGRNRELLLSPEAEGDWGPRALLDWTRRLRHSRRYDEQVTTAVSAAQAIDDLYANNQLRSRAAAGPKSSLKYSMTSTSPCTAGTDGDQSSSSVARVISGRRRFGSSSGNGA